MAPVNIRIDDYLKARADNVTVVYEPPKAASCPLCGQAHIQSRYTPLCRALKL